MRNITDFLRLSGMVLTVSVNETHICGMVHAETGANFCMTDASGERLLAHLDKVCADKLARMARPKDAWTNLIPIDHGMYWRRYAEHGDKGFMVRVVMNPEQVPCVIEKGKWGSADKLIPIVNDTSEWYGPLSPPE